MSHFVDTPVPLRPYGALYAGNDGDTISVIPYEDTGRVLPGSVFLTPGHERYSPFDLIQPQRHQTCMVSLSDLATVFGLNVLTSATRHCGSPALATMMSSVQQAAVSVSGPETLLDILLRISTALPASDGRKFKERDTQHVVSQAVAMRRMLSAIPETHSSVQKIWSKIPGAPDIHQYIEDVMHRQPHVMSDYFEMDTPISEAVLDLCTTVIDPRMLVCYTGELYYDGLAIMLQTRSLEEVQGEIVNAVTECGTKTPGTRDGLKPQQQFMLRVGHRVLVTPLEECPSEIASVCEPYSGIERIGAFISAVLNIWLSRLYAAEPGSLSWETDPVDWIMGFVYPDRGDKDEDDGMEFSGDIGAIIFDGDN
jgi:hypothetical protein